MRAPLLTTKFHVPLPRAGMSPRPRLLALLNEGLRQGHRLTLVSAPAGYGKTTLIAEWIHAAQERDVAFPRVAWLSLDEGDHDPAQFFVYLIGALQTMDGHIGQAAESLLDVPQLPPVESLMTFVLNDLAALSTPLLLVLDDYHLIQDVRIHTAMQFLLDHQPPTVHVVLMTREDPPLSLGRLRVRGQMTEIRAAALRFTEEEAIHFFNQTMGLALSPEAVGVLDARTEGWIAGLQLAALSLQGRDDVDGFIHGFSGSHRYVIDYLMEEVLGRQPPKIRSFLHQTAVLERLTGPLCDALLDVPPDDRGAESPGQAILEWLERANLFVVPLDEQRCWYRYHQLFVEVLRSDLDPEMQTLLHRRASRWFEENGLPAEAIRHALAGEDLVTAQRLIVRSVEEVFQSLQFTLLLGWIDALPEAAVLECPKLAVYKAWVLFLTGKIEAAQDYFAVIEAAPAVRADPLSRGRLGALRAWIANFYEEPETRALAQEALGLLGNAEPFFRFAALNPLGLAQARAGDVPGAIQTFRQTYELGQRLDYPLITAAAVSNLCINLNAYGRRREAAAICQEALAHYADGRGEPLPCVRLFYLPLAMVHYEANLLAKAYDYIREARIFVRQMGLETTVAGDGEVLLAMIQAALGDDAAAFETLREACLLAERLHNLRYQSAFEALIALLRLRQGDLASAAAWAEGMVPSQLCDPSYELVTTIYLRVRIAQQRYEEARSLLAALENAVRRGGRFRRLITLHLLDAQMQQALGAEEQSVQALERAVRLAEPEGYLRAFLDEGVPVLTLLPQVRVIAPAFVTQLFEASPPATGTPMHPTSLPAVQPLIEPLSERELEILRLIAAGLSNREIAETLFITTGTTKWHLTNIYGKLGVASRTQALVKAQDLGII